jgi:DNA-binding XRE family transcriptional regulator
MFDDVALLADWRVTRDAKLMMNDLKSLRKLTGLTQYDMARNSGVPKWRYSLIEAQQIEPSVAEEAALRATLGRSLQAIAVKAAQIGSQLSGSVAV